MLRAIWFTPPVIHRIAKRDGLFEQAGLAIESSMTTSSDEQFESLSKGRQDFAITAMDNVIMWKRRPGGAAFRIFAQIEASTNIVLIARPEFQTIEALAGNRILVDSSTNGFVIPLRAMLANKGVMFDHCEIIESGGVKERFERLLAGAGDATILGPPFSDIAKAAGMVELGQADQEFPGYPGQGLVASTHLDVARREELAAWLRAVEKARQVAHREPLPVIELLVADGLPASSAQAIAASVGPSLIPDSRGVGLVIEQRLRLGLPGGDDHYDDLVDLSLLRGAALTVSDNTFGRTSQ